MLLLLGFIFASINLSILWIYNAIEVKEML